MIYQEIQEAIEACYDLRVPWQVKHFVSHDKVLVEQLSGEMRSASEVLLIHQDTGKLDVTLFLEQELIDSTNMASSDHYASDSFQDFCTILEGVSHFVYLVWNAQYGRQIKPVEMELQAEVDKFVFAAMSSARTLHRQPGSDPMHQGLTHCLFESVNFMHSPGSELYERYRKANEFAQCYCSWLSRHFQFTGNDGSLRAELARFYRMNAVAKFEHINRHCVQ